MTTPQFPPFGPRMPTPFTCQRASAAGWQTLCGEPAGFHIIWEETSEGCENGMACAKHAVEATNVWRPEQVHTRGPDCGMPGSCWFREEKTCRVPDDGSGVDELIAASSFGTDEVRQLAERTPPEVVERIMRKVRSR